VAAERSILSRRGIGAIRIRVDFPFVGHHPEYLPRQRIEAYVLTVVVGGRWGGFGRGLGFVVGRGGVLLRRRLGLPPARLFVDPLLLLPPRNLLPAKVLQSACAQAQTAHSLGVVGSKSRLVIHLVRP
jgi:hypothetical protein